MKKTDKKQIAESIGIAAIVASLVFVGMQMQQDRRLARAELGSFALEFRASVDFGMSDPEILRSARGMMLRECYLMAMEVFGECESLVGGVAREYFSNKYAQAWWRHHHLSNPYGTGDILNEIVTNANSEGNLEAIEKVKGDL
jgi:hypothetical protein